MSGLLQHAKKLPLINWNFTFFGAHLQNVVCGWDYPNENHVAFELIYVLNGVEQIDCNPYTYIINKGDFAIISPGIYHHVSAKANLTYFCFHFDLDEPTFGETLIANSKLIYHQGESLNKLLTPDLNKLIHQIHNHDDNYNLEEKMRIQILFSDFLLKLYSNLSHSHTLENISAMQYAKLIRVHIKNSVLSKISNALSKSSKSIVAYDDIITDGCNQLHLSMGYAAHIFKMCYGKSPKSYLSDVKRETAQKLLLKPQFNIKQIAFLLGYHNPVNFSRQFKLWTGLPPKQFRKMKVSHFVDRKLFNENFTLYSEYSKATADSSNLNDNFWDY